MTGLPPRMRLWILVAYDSERVAIGSTSIVHVRNNCQQNVFGFVMWVYKESSKRLKQLLNRRRRNELKE